MEVPQNPTLLDVITQAMRVTKSGLRVSLPGEIQSFDPITGLAFVKPQLKDLAEDIDGNETVLDLPVIPNVPVIFPGGGGYRMTFPLLPGDTVLLVFTDRSLDLWLQAGGNVDPVDPRQHDLTDAVAIPAMLPQSRPWTGNDNTSLTLGKDGGAQIRLTPATVQLGGLPAVLPIIKGPPYLAAEATFYGLVGTALGALQSYVAAVATGAGVTGLAPVSTAGTAAGTAVTAAGTAGAAAWSAASTAALSTVVLTE